MILNHKKSNVNIFADRICDNTRLGVEKLCVVLRSKISNSLSCLTPCRQNNEQGDLRKYYRHSTQMYE